MSDERHQSPPTSRNEEQPWTVSSNNDKRLSFNERECFLKLFRYCEVFRVMHWCWSACLEIKVPSSPLNSSMFKNPSTNSQWFPLKISLVRIFWHLQTEDVYALGTWHYYIHQKHYENPSSRLKDFYCNEIQFRSCCSKRVLSEQIAHCLCVNASKQFFSCHPTLSETFFTSPL